MCHCVTISELKQRWLWSLFGPQDGLNRLSALSASTRVANLRADLDAMKEDMELIQDARCQHSTNWGDSGEFKGRDSGISVI